jgi:hypothetical protein
MSNHDGITPATSTFYLRVTQNISGNGLTISKRKVLSWSEIPTHMLRAELQRRREDEEPSVCGSKGGKGHYNTPAHVAALIIILSLSTAGWL